MPITKAERTELRSVVRNQFKVLRQEILQRRAELAAEMYREVEERTHDEDAKQESVQFMVHERVRECNRAINDLLYEHGYQTKSGSEAVWVEAPRVFGSRFHGGGKASERLSRAVSTDLDAKVAHAKSVVDRQEADLLRELTIGALETAEARAFLDKIPTVTELVPVSRLIEIEAAMKDQGD